MIKTVVIFKLCTKSTNLCSQLLSKHPQSLRKPKNTDISVMECDLNFQSCWDKKQKTYTCYGSRNSEYFCCVWIFFFFWWVCMMCVGGGGEIKKKKKKCIDASPVLLLFGRNFEPLLIRRERSFVEKTYSKINLLSG